MGRRASARRRIHDARHDVASAGVHARQYKTSVLRSPRLALISLQQSLSEVTAPVFRADELGPRQRPDPQLRQGRRCRSASASSSTATCATSSAGRCRTRWSRSGSATRAAAIATRRTSTSAPLDPNFGGCGRMLTDENGYYAYRTIKPGPYPWRNRVNDWRPAHIHYAISGDGWVQRLITQMYFEGDPLIGAARSWRHPERGAGPRPDRAAGHRAASCSSTAAPTASTSCCAASARRCSRTSVQARKERGMSASRSGQLRLSARNRVADRRPVRAHRPRAPGAGFDIFENNFGNVLVDAETQGRAHPHRRPRLRRHRQPCCATC